MHATDPKFTPGHWFVADRYRVLVDDDRRTIVHVPPCSWTNEEAQADARLIAAAPDLYAALDKLLPGLGVIGATMLKDKIAACHAALRKARGEP